jgi:hypothetical protein
LVDGEALVTVVVEVEVASLRSAIEWGKKR